ncbi:MAG: hypothetical protein K6A32_03710 [Bacteroidales bacterium]|nr:hypothetical protein [Bacteroidales bacterium]
MARCITCKNGRFMQWMENPVIAYCNILRERFVAECDRQCKFYTPTTSESKEIIHYDHYEDDNNF